MGTDASGFGILSETSLAASYSTSWYFKIWGLPSSTTFRGQPYDWNGENYCSIYFKQNSWNTPSLNLILLQLVAHGVHS